MTPEEKLIENINESTGAANDVYELEHPTDKQVMRIKLAMCILKTAFSVDDIRKKTPVDKLDAHLIECHVTTEHAALLQNLLDEHPILESKKIPAAVDLIKIMRSKTYIQLLQHQADYSNIRYLSA